MGTGAAGRGREKVDSCFSQLLNQTFGTLKKDVCRPHLDFSLCDSDHTSASYHWGTQASNTRVQ